MNNWTYISFIFCFLFLSSCGSPDDDDRSIGYASRSKVRVKVYSHGASDRVRSRKPIIYNLGGEQVCRYYPYRVYEVRQILTQKVKIKKAFLDYLFGEGTDQEGQNEESKPVKINVGKGWLKFGLEIVNANKDIHLIVQELHYTAEASYRGAVYNHSGVVGAGYCEGPPFLYFAPPEFTIKYKTFQKAPLEDLTIFLSGFPIIGGDSSSGRVVIPNYAVELTLIGYFITPSNNELQGVERVTDFEKKVKFRTTSTL